MSKRAVEKRDCERDAITMEALQIYLRNRRSAGGGAVRVVRVSIDESDWKKLALLAGALSHEKKVTPGVVASAIIHLTLEKMEKRSDALLADMQNPENRARLDAFFDATPEELGKAAVEAARKKPRNPKRA